MTEEEGKRLRSLNDILSSLPKEQQEKTQHEGGASVILKPRCLTRPIAVARVLRTYGVRLRDAHLAIDRLAAGNSVEVHLGPAYDMALLRHDLSALGVDVDYDER